MRLEFPGGQWADCKTAPELTGADQDRYYQFIDAAVERSTGDAPQQAAEPQPDPDNPAMLLPAPPPPEPKFTNQDGRDLRDEVIGMIVTGWSFDLPLPYTTASRKELPLPVCNALKKAADDLADVLRGEDPKEEEGSTTGTSATSSQADAPAPLQEPPAAS